MTEDYSQHASGPGGQTGGVAKTGSGPAAAGGGAAADRGGAAASGGGTAKAERHDLRERVKRAPWWTNMIGLLALVGSAVVTVLWIVEVIEEPVAACLIALVGLVIGIVPLFRT